MTASRMSRALNKFCPFGSTSTCPSSMSCRCSKLIGHSCSNPVHIDHQHRTESTHGQAVSTVREPFCSKIPFSQRGRLMNSVSFTMLYTRPLKPCVRRILWLLRLLCYGFQESCRCQESCCVFQFGARKSRASILFNVLPVLQYYS